MAVISFDRVVGVEIYIRPGRGLDAIPTNDVLTLVPVGGPVAERDANRADIEGNFFKTLGLAQPFAERGRAAIRVDQFVGAAVPKSRALSQRCVASAYRSSTQDHDSLPGPRRGSPSADPAPPQDSRPRRSAPR
jgi:hypothetical protein